MAKNRSPNEDIARANSVIDRDIKKHLQNTRKLLMQPSSSQEGIGIRECAELVAKMYERAGCEKVEIAKTKGNPIVYGETTGSSESTMLAYFMYDTMPFNESGWTSPAMGAKTVDMKLPAGKVKAIVNRGADNTKGPLAAFLNAVEACNKSSGRTPVRLLLVAEGEEELGSTSLMPYVKKEKPRLSRADACYFPYFAQDSDGTNSLYLGVKGDVYFELECSGSRWGRGPEEFAIHSANKAWVDSPVWRLIDALGTMVSENGSRIKVEGFHDDIAPPSKEDQEIISKSSKRLNTSIMKKSMKVKRFMVPEEDREGLLREYTYGTTLNIDGIWSGWIEKGSKTVLPHKATCKLDIRLVPDQDSRKMLALVRKHLDSHGFEDVKMTEIDHALEWCRVSVKEPVVQAMLRSLRAFGDEPIVWPTSGGALPFYVFSRVLGLPFTMGGAGHSDLAHSPNEYMVVEGNDRLKGLAEVEKFMVHFMNEFGSIGHRRTVS